MHPITHIRKNVLGMTQRALAKLTGVNQATVSRWEDGSAEPSRSELNLIRAEVSARGLAWDDRWIWETPPTVLDATSESEHAA